ncbi:HEPN domain-containing protein [Desulfonema limicola]|uniref:HEPN domain-containing protein n=1 Tax=Desulfonema limicola TaxID=45656 RepID=A0A975BE51_9BACT|nr:HEPN domain-containing protein [Desulfonema limicola]QTA83732.1 HEPN domain-containing protein [Desulfonema limicola]
MKTGFLSKAKANIEAAQICFENGFYDACANRAYYAALQAAISALADKGFNRSKADHKQIQADFSEKLIKRKKVYPAKLKSYLMDMQGVRNQADYTDEGISKNLANQQISKAAQMIGLIEKELKK